MQQTMEGADAYIGERPMENWEEAAWDTMNFEEAPDRSDERRPRARTPTNAGLDPVSDVELPACVPFLGNDF